MDVTVVGAGVIGLTTALVLEGRGHRVRIVAAHTGAQTTSDVAGAVWFPYRAGPPEKVAVWAAYTRTWLEELARTEPAAGVDLLTGYEITAGDGSEKPWWAAAIDVDRAPAPVNGSPMAWRFSAPRAQPSLFLPYLASKLRAPIERHTVTELAAEPGDAVINCTGLAARELVRDESIYGLFGQLVIAEHGGADIKVTITDDRDPDDFFYIIPRRDELVLGGCSIPMAAGDTAEKVPAIAERILRHAKSLGIHVGNVRTERIGLRPYRPNVRLERDAEHPRVIHNYGHGGSGFTLCRGCAEDVAALL